MYPEVPRWIFAVVLLFLVIGLIAWARGQAHHHGQYVGSMGAVHSTTQALQG